VSLALVIQHAEGMRLIILASMACLALQHFSTLSHTRQDFREKNSTDLKMRVLIFSTPLSEIFLVLRKVQRDTVINVETSSWKVPVILCQILMKLEFSGQIFEKSSNIKFHGIRPVGAVFFLADG
jgi:hypothetical protein